MLRTAGLLALLSKALSAGFDAGISPVAAAQLLGGWTPTETGLSPASPTRLRWTHPNANLGTNPDVAINATDMVPVVLVATNVPLASTVNVRIVPRYGSPFVVAATSVAGSTPASSHWTAMVTFPNGYCAIQARAVLPKTP